ncbi:endonuclease domain-containing protein [Jongsikchunia kroppenstedtii]|uniref:endonuclease domain-containing protein n=1 Tax=Jongsikchunia kroppenstedtii TaxID=1121721 RepID=UPI00037A674D|nr:DUF559 domain-containing protein [Jongsikchunia kroppenstedtii]
MTGVYRTCELKQRGLSDAHIRQQVTTGDLLPIRRGWYALRLADQKTVEAVRTGGVLSCVSALGKHGIWVPPDSRVHVRFPLEDRHNRRSCRGFGRMPPIDTAIDPVLAAYCCAARCLDDEGFVAVSDSILNTTPLEIADLRCALSAAPQRITRLLDRCDGRAQSGTESIARVRFRKARIKVRVQVRITGIGIVDLLIGERLIVECDSVAFHTGAENYQRDRDRDRRAAVDGYITIRLTYNDILYRWDAVLADILDLVKRREHRRKPRKP